MKSVMIIPAVAAVTLTALAGCDPSPIDDAKFANPPRACYPCSWWHWMDGEITAEGLTADLAAMEQAGISGVTVFDGGGSGPVDYLTPKWLELFRHACAEAKKRGIEVSAANCGGWSSSGGPWITPELAMKRIVSSEAKVTGGGRRTVKLAKPQAKENFYREIGVWAVREWMTPLAATVAETSVDMTLTYDFGRPQTVRGLHITFFKNGEAHFAVKASDDGRSWRTVRTLWYKNRRSRNDVGVTRSFSLPPFTARYVKLDSVGKWQRLGEACKSAFFSSAETVEDSDERNAGTVGEFDTYSHAQYAPIDPKAAVARPDSIDLTAQFDAKTDTLTWDAPAGDWRVLRFAATCTGMRQVSSSDAGTGLECDKLSTAALDFHFDRLLAKFGDAAKELKGFLVDSNEVRGDNWTEGIFEEFAKRMGYDPKPYLPAMCGAPVGTLRNAERFLWDWRKLVSELYTERYYAHFGKRCREAGLVSTVEPYDGPFECLSSGKAVDIPKGETWLVGGDEPGPRMKLASSIASLYGKPLVASESFTSFGFAEGGWNESIPMIRRTADCQFAGGVNKTVLHSIVHQPFVRDDARPGFGLFFFGTHFGRNQTWWPMAHELMAYMARCQYLLRLGLPVNDILVYQGDEMPNSFQKNGGPGDVFTVGGFKRSGYDFELVDEESLLSRARVEAGRIRIGNGSYAVLDIPTNRLCNVSTLQAIKRLLVAGATVVADRPEGQATLVGYPQSDATFASLVTELWGAERTPSGERKVGAGTLAWGVDYREVGDRFVKQRDFDCDGNEKFAVWCHRRGPGFDTYLVGSPCARSYEKSELADYTVRFRVTGRVPEVFDAATGSICDAADWRATATNTEVKLTLGNNQSVFVVFRRPAKDAPAEFAAREKAKVVKTPIAGGWTLRFPSGMGAPKEVKWAKLQPITESDVEPIKYYSGIVEYETAFDFGDLSEGRRYVFNLGEIGRGCMAEATLNGKALAGVWTQPGRCDVTGILRKGANTLVIRLATPWSNRLVGDNNRMNKGWKAEAKADLENFRAGKPRQGKDWTWLANCVWHGFTREKEQKLRPSGLIEGPFITQE